ncbi:MAG TPA: response regulator [Pyrinomonadaceae bacterium]|nr:response regulator [Pyrinomonadaceae bacterium]
MRPSSLSKPRSVQIDTANAIRARHLKVMIVDDEAVWRRSMRFRLMSLYDLEVKDVGSGDEALRTITSGERFDLIFLDLSMPEMSGTQAFERLRDIDPNCAVVMMSAYSDGEEWAKAKQLNVQVLSKPIMDDELEKVLLEVP